MRVILINTPLRFARNPEMSSSYPLGLMYLAATLEREGIDVRIIDFVSETRMNRIRKRIRENKADIFGISVLTDNRFTAFDIAGVIRQIHKDAKIVLGGAHPTALYSQILDNMDVDAVFLGESESSFLEYVTKGFYDRKDLGNIAGIAFKDSEGNNIVTEPEPEEDIDSIPEPAFHLIDLDNYRNSLNEIDFHIMTSRGCPFRCNFCSVSSFYKGSYRTHSISRVLKELAVIESFKRKGRVMLHDDFFAAKGERTQSLCRGIIRNGIRISWSARSRVDCVDLETLKLMRESGCEQIFFGVETGSPRILNAMNKDLRLDDVENAFRLTKKAGITSICNIMIGYPGEDRVTLNQTRKLLSAVKPDKVYSSPVQIFPGTELYSQCLKDSIIKESFWIESKKSPPVYKTSIGYKGIFWNMYKMKLSVKEGFLSKAIITLNLLIREAKLQYARLLSILR